MNKITSAGGLTVENDHILLIRVESGKLAIPKGHIDPGETVEQAAMREVEEETGVKPRIVGYLGEFIRPSTEDSGEVVTKTVEVYKMREVGLSDLPDAGQGEWVAAEAALGDMHFREEIDFIKAHLQRIK